MDVDPTTTNGPGTHGDVVPNHHRDHPGFGGVRGFAMALLFRVATGERSRLVVRLAGARAGDTVVDIGCGPGTAVRHAANLGATAIGIDPAPVMLRVARLTARHDRARYVAGSAEALPLGDGVADTAWSMATVHHWRDVDAGIAEVARVLRPGGRFLALEAVSSPGATGVASHGWTPQQADAFAERLRAGGFVDVAIEQHAGSRRRMISVAGTRA
jgi:ubiquinone/menaquinone biosynthesis C-methylase UbiE